MQSLQSTVLDGAVGTSDELGDSSHLENFLSNDVRRSQGRSRGADPQLDAGTQQRSNSPHNLDDPDGETSPNMELGSAMVAKLISSTGETPCPYDEQGNPFFRPPAFRTRGLSYSPEDAGDHYHTPLQRQLRALPPAQLAKLARGDVHVRGTGEYKYSYYRGGELCTVVPALSYAHDLGPAGLCVPWPLAPH